MFGVVTIKIDHVDVSAGRTTQKVNTDTLANLIIDERDFRFIFNRHVGADTHRYIVDALDYKSCSKSCFRGVTFRIDMRDCDLSIDQPDIDADSVQKLGGHV